MKTTNIKTYTTAELRAIYYKLYQKAQDLYQEVSLIKTGCNSGPLGLSENFNTYSAWVVALEDISERIKALRREKEELLAEQAKFSIQYASRIEKIIEGFNLKNTTE